MQLIGSDLATAEDAELMSALAVGIQDQELGRLASLEGVPAVLPGAGQAPRQVQLPSRNEAVPVDSATTARILQDTEKLIAAAERSAR